MTSSTAGSVRQHLWWLAVPWPVLLVAGLMFVGLLAMSGAYGFHGDEMYYQSTCGFRSSGGCLAGPGQPAPNSHEGSERVTMSRFRVPTPIGFVVGSDALHALSVEHQAHPSDQMLEVSVEPAQTARP